ncbi:folylpolyglutamate synthase 1 isoform X1 [Bombus vancouverensis nearcticus]|uniref:Folylpolyglutamate synthase n=1 Tax=Bombus bifarius TaxID=103933 RepID=A0A6P8LZ45_9HYME|nr:folylpolyglutamate synthase, mitochondrial isoform X1 [Bombus vancouverensis nearcticus]XP_033300678.1 folylpolyglutamate synthase, mitochondrial isoform X1 [Bombus bifarius]
MWDKLIKRYVCVASYEAAIQALHGLQSNSNYLKLVTKDNSQANAVRNLPDTKKYLIRSGITLEKLDTLSVIHIAGTKGKGSTCAYTEAILREHGFKTGFFSSPHLVNARERIRISGQPISKIQFTQNFWKIYKKLEDTKEHESDMPTYFKFLTILMFNTFLDEHVDVAIIEVGIGGLYDCTNIIRNPVCVGITSLGLDHTSLLGNTVEDIAYQKSGIFKSGTVAFSVPQLSQAMRILEERAIERNCKLRVIPSFDEYKWENLSPILQIKNKVQQQNASIAIQMATEWLLTRNKVASVSMDKIAIALTSCKWPGRMQILRSSIGDFFLDGAHTIDSIECCISWFNDTSSGSKGKKVLIFNTSGTRDPIQLLIPLRSLHFYKAYFVPNLVGIKSLDNEMNSSSTDEQKIKCEINSKIWGMNSVVANNVLEVLEDIKKNLVQKNNCERYQILVTGSLHLIGAVLAILDPNLTMNTEF